MHRSMHRDPGRIVVVGAGPHALTLCSYLLTADPERRHALTVVDPDGWMAAWNGRLRRLAITVLRSPGVHHPDPAPYALHHFAERRPGGLVGPYRSPTTDLFDGFCRHLVRRHRLDLLRRCGRVTAIRAGSGHARHIVELASGCRLPADHVIVATNAVRPRTPVWAPLDALHADAVDVRSARRGERIVVVGGGLTAAQLALGAGQAGAAVTVLARTALRCRQTDAAPGWLSSHLLAPYFAERSWERRAATYRSARAGTMPAPWAEQLRAAGSVTLEEAVAVHSVSARGDGVEVSTNAGTFPADRLWLATGSRYHVRHDPLLSGLGTRVPSVDGLPLVDADLRLPGTEIHVMGEAAALQIGALAPNLAGARMAAERIVAALTSRSPGQYPHPESPHGSLTGGSYARPYGNPTADHGLDEARRLARR